MALTPSPNPLPRWFFGFFGSLIAVAILPRTLVLIFRRTAGRILAEALAIALMGFLSNRMSSRSPRRRR